MRGLWSFWLMLWVFLIPPVMAEEGVAAPIPMDQWDMQQLPADWWRQLQEKDVAVLKQKMDVFQAKWIASRSLLTAEQQQQLANSFESISTSSRAYVELVGKTVNTQVKPVAVSESYLLPVWLDAIHDLRKSSEDQHQLQERAQQISEQTAAVAKEADNASAAYYAATSEARLPLLFEVLEQRLAWLVANESLRLIRANVDLAQAQWTQAETHWRLATDHLRFSEQDVKALDDQIAQEKKLHEKHIDALRVAQADAVLVWGDDEASKAKSQFQQILALRAAMDVAQSQARLVWLDQVKVYLQARANKGFDWDAQLRAPVQAWQQAVKQLDQQRKQWRGQIEQRREQVQSALLILAENPPEGMPVKALQQAKQTHQQSIKALAEAHAALKGLHAQLDDSEALLQLQQKLLLAHDGVWGSRWHQFSQALQSAWDEVVDLMTASIFKIGDTPVTLLGLIRVVIFLTLAWWASYWLRQGLQRVASRNQKIAPHTAYTLGRLIHYLIMIVGTVVALSSVGIDFSNIAWIAGALSVGIGFGLQDVVKNFVAGLIVMFEKTLKVGDFIELPSGISGTVKEISLRSTLITTGDNLEVVVPNAEFTSGRVVNWTLSDAYRRVHIPFAVSLQADKKQVVDAVLLAASRVPYTISEMHREPQVVLGGLEGKMSFELLVWIKQGSVKHAYGVKASYLWQIETALREQGIELV